MTNASMPAGQDSELNMTPMIDIVFQLIIFFLLSLKFKAVDRRIDSALPKTEGPGFDTQFQDDQARITVKLFRENIETPDPGDDLTLIRVGNRATFTLPAAPWTGDGEEDARHQEQVDRVSRALSDTIREVAREMGRGDVEGVIKTPRPKGLRVPHGDVMTVLDAFVAAGLQAVRFEGAPPPLPAAR